MSEPVEVVAITGTSTILEASPELKDSSAVLELHTTTTTTTSKRQLNESDLENPSPKKLCTDIDETLTAQVIESESVIDETIVSDSKAPEDHDNELVEPSIVEPKISDENPLEELEEEEDLMMEIIASSQELEQTNEEAEEEEIEESFEHEESDDFSEEENSSDDDESMMARAMRASDKFAPPTKPKPIQNDEPIALDDSDEDEPAKDVKDDSSEFSVNNEVLGESDEEEEVEEEEDEYAALQEARRRHAESRVTSAQKLVKRSLVILRAKKRPSPRTPSATTKTIALSVNTKSPAESLDAAKALDKTPADVTEKKSTSVVETEPEVEPMVVEDSANSKTEDELPPQEVPAVLEKKTEEIPNQIVLAEQKKSEIPTPVESEKADETNGELNDKATDKESAEHSNESSRHESSLLTEITNSTTEEVFTRYVLKTNDQSPTLDEFSEELYYCLQLNNMGIEKAKQLWNEKLHVKYKIRELMETIRRHRAVMEIEAFGYKPEASGNNSHPIISSKSSTTTNSETDHYEKHMSSESVSRLIENVRASMLKRSEKQRCEEGASTSNAGDNSLQWNSLQANSAQGRQGQIIDVQSIINDFRQKNPQEIPRRGRRMKSSFGSGFYDNQQSPIDEARGSRSDFMSNVTNNHNDFSSTMKSNHSGYPEVSLHPVQNLYKSLATASGPSGSGAGGFSGPRSSLLQSILTKQSTKSPIGFPNHQLPSTSTLARLLTAPERSFQGTTKQTIQPPARQSSNKVRNGEITITPIGHSSRSKDYAMEDDDNSMEPPLVIDEAFEMNEPVKSVSDLFCQGCKKNKAFFMCAGCSRQWYCSKECQEMAWDEHAESCMN